MSETTNIEFHFAPDFLNLLVDTIARLNRSKRDVLLFFRGAGTPNRCLDDLESDIRQDKNSHNKFDLARTLLVRLNEAGDACLAPRREVVKRVVEFEDFTRCWESDVLEAKGLVAEVQRLVNVKDSFTRINQEREREQQQARATRDAEVKARQEQRQRVEAVKRDLFALFAETNPHNRGKALEGVLNRLFQVHDILVREAFTLSLEEGGVIEQIDGVVELDGHIYLVEMKWWSTPLGVGETGQHLVRIFSRDGARGIFISASGFTEGTVQQYREALRQRVVVLMTLKEIVDLLNNEGDLKILLKQKVIAAITDKNPLTS